MLERDLGEFEVGFRILAEKEEGLVFGVLNFEVLVCRRRMWRRRMWPATTVFSGDGDRRGW